MQGRHQGQEAAPKVPAWGSPQGLAEREVGAILLVHAGGLGFIYRRSSTALKARIFFLSPPNPCPWSPGECYLLVPASSRAEGDMRAGKATCSQQACLPLTDLDGPFVPRSSWGNTVGKEGVEGEAWASDREASLGLEDRGVT